MNDVIARTRIVALHGVAGISFAVRSRSFVQFIAQVLGRDRFPVEILDERPRMEFSS